MGRRAWGLGLRPSTWSQFKVGHDNFFLHSIVQYVFVWLRRHGTQQPSATAPCCLNPQESNQYLYTSMTSRSSKQKGRLVVCPFKGRKVSTVFFFFFFTNASSIQKNICQVHYVYGHGEKARVKFLCLTLGLRLKSQRQNPFWHQMVYVFLFPPEQWHDNFRQISFSDLF